MESVREHVEVFIYGGLRMDMFVVESREKFESCFKEEEAGEDALSISLLLEWCLCKCSILFNEPFNFFAHFFSLSLYLNHYHHYQ